MSNAFTDDRSIDDALNASLMTLEQIQQAALVRMQGINENSPSSKQLYSKYFENGEIQAKTDAYNQVQKEIFEIRNAMRSNVDDVREELGGDASESYIMARANKRNRELQKRLDQIEDDGFLAQLDLNSAVSHAEKMFQLESIDLQEQRSMQQSLLQTELGMTMQMFDKGWGLLMAEKDRQEKEYWNNKSFQQKIDLMSVSEQNRRDAFIWDLQMQQKYASA